MSQHGILVNLVSSSLWKSPRYISWSRNYSSFLPDDFSICSESPVKPHLRALSKSCYQLQRETGIFLVSSLQ